MNFLCDGVGIVIAQYLGIKEMWRVNEISKTWKEVFDSDIVWKALYFQHFGDTRPSRNDNYHFSYKNYFKSRLSDPLEGDIIQARWSGIFGFADGDLYTGTGWWNAVIFGKSYSRQQLWVQYSGFGNEWEKWVERSEWRWPPTVDKTTILAVGDVVEVHLAGISTSCFLECEIETIDGDIYGIGNILVSGQTKYVFREDIVRKLDANRLLQ